ncbi:GntR family transcriptional regulator [bacterium]|nr:GntR family transcriptional regulator [bacterium]MBU1066136.1 GntR family transcriptional regulator [bacterium]MBU1634288.1 GntR family transcriptional regulator [bacterium]MBU1875260.1 GntR family transcriptional regulator [bacterium]
MEFEKEQAIYLQIADLICENILSGEWTEEERIPSVRELAVATEVNPNTAMRSYAWLQEKGIIQNRRGIGYFVSGGAVEKTRTLKKEEFINNQLPQLFKTMDLLNIRFDELKTLYDNH